MLSKLTIALLEMSHEHCFDLMPFIIFMLFRITF